MSVISDLAGRARAQAPPRGAGRYAYIHTQGWYLATDQLTDGRVLRSEVEVSDRELWLASDGSGRIREARAGRPSAATGRYEASGLATGPDLGGPVVGLTQRLRQQHPDRGPAQWIDAVREIWSTQVVQPAVQAELLSLLAELPGLQVHKVTDRVDRPGLAVSADSAGRGPRTRTTLVLDPDSGTLLGFEETALEAGGLPIRTPATIGYTVWLTTGYAADTDSRP